MSKSKHEVFYDELNSLVKEFQAKKKGYAIKYKTMKTLSIFFTVLTTLFMGFTFIDNISIVIKIIAIVLSAISSIVIAWDKIIDYKKQWQQRTQTLVSLLEIKREYKVFILPNIQNEELVNSKIDELLKSLNTIMKEDFKIWDNNVSSYGNV